MIHDGVMPSHTAPWHHVPPHICPQKYQLVPEEGFLVGAGEDMDFALVAVAPVSERGVPLSDWGYLKLDGRPNKVAEGEYITIIQVGPRAHCLSQFGALCAHEMNHIWNIYCLSQFGA